VKEQPWMEIARKKLGIHEIPGPRTEKFIGDCLESVGLPRDDSISWCSAFVNRVLQLAKVKGTGSGMARSWLKWGREITEEDPEELWKGCICVLWREDPDGNLGHVGFLNDWDDDRVQLLGGNQSDSVSLAWFPNERVLGFRVLKGV
jgi:uncharacterized protein (TIGR02594 family)